MDVIANAMTNAIDAINTVVWGYILIYGLLAVGIYFSIRLRFLQIFRFREFIRAVTRTPEKDSQGITPIQALTTSLASRVGTGNIAGVAVAVYTGGPGALFWMWIVALLGMATAYAESALAQLYKVNDHHGLYRGGPAFYISRGLKSPWAGAVFSVALLVVFGLVFNAVQANAISESFSESFGLDRTQVGVGVAVLSGIVIFGGIRNIARVAEVVVPFMAVAYLGVALWVLVANVDKIPDVLVLIVRSAFGMDQAVGGVVGGMTAAMLNGVKRGLYSNEAGMGSAPNIAAVAIPSPHHPSSQGFVQALGVFIDTAAGDLGSSAARKFDCEAWLPTQQRWMEVTSTSNCTTYQARRLAVRERREGGTSPVATLNGTLATTRWMVAILENHQQADGSVRVPAGLRPYLGGLEVIEPVGATA